MRGRAEPEKEGGDGRRIGAMEEALGVDDVWVEERAELAAESSLLQGCVEASTEFLRSLMFPLAATGMLRIGCRLRK